jgi:hypothetical protein
MNREDIIRMALEAGLQQDGDNFFSKTYEEMDVHINDLERFAALVASAEREACAKVCDELYFQNYPDAEEWERSEEGESIRARGQA